jgi:hypothetical protein
VETFHYDTAEANLLEQKNSGSGSQRKEHLYVIPVTLKYVGVVTTDFLKDFQFRSDPDPSLQNFIFFLFNLFSINLTTTSQ